MPAWVNLDSELPLKLRKDVANIALEVWKAAGSNHVTSLDGWWYTSHCLYLPFPDGSPAVIVINCMEGEADQPKQQCRYMVDVVRQRVKNMEDNSYKSILPASDEAVIRIVDWVQGIHERDPAAARAQQQRRLEAAERYRQQELQRRREHDDAFEVYRKRIADFQTSQPTPSKRARVDFRQEVPGGPNTKVASSCPECSKVLVHCNKCSKFYEFVSSHFIHKVMQELTFGYYRAPVVPQKGLSRTGQRPFLSMYGRRPSKRGVLLTVPRGGGRYAQPARSSLSHLRRGLLW